MDKITITIDSQYYREQFEDWLAGGTVEFDGKTYYWSADNVRYGWDIESIDDDKWSDIDEHDQEKIFKLIEECLAKHNNSFVKYVR